MILTVDGIEYKNIVVNSLQRKLINETGGNSGTFLSGEKFHDVRNSYYQYTLTLSPSLAQKEEYEELYALLALPVEEHEITVPYGQTVKTFKCYVSSVSDRLRKKLPTGNIWENFSVTFSGTEARKV